MLKVQSLKNIFKYPTPSNLSYFWNFGSLLGICLIIQILTGILLGMHYCANVNYAFHSIQHILRDVPFGWLLKYIHANTASLFFVCVYIHIARSLYYGLYTNKSVWFSGIILFFLMMLTAFLGYVLPWGQMSYWGATVISNFISVLPYLGQDIVYWIWGGFSVDNATLNRFFSLHYLFPFLIFTLVIIHIISLHEKGSSNPNGLNSDIDKISFHSYFTIKDILGLFIFLIFFVFLIFFYPHLLGDPENNIPANPLVTPLHIMPEWYFLFAYAILRCIPNKAGGVIALVLSIAILFLIPFIVNINPIISKSYNPIGKLIFWCFIINFFFLTWLGSKPVNYPYTILAIYSTLFYFTWYLLINPLSDWINYKILF